MTFSIVARDPRTGAVGVATATAGPMVGALVPHAQSGRGAAATQAMTNPYLAIDILALLEHQPAGAALRSALERDPDADLRQVIVVDSEGRVDGWTGGECLPYAGHLTGIGVAVAGNMLAGPAVLEDMLQSYLQEEPDSSLAQRLLRALLAGAAAGGDSRGIGSAALRVYGNEAFPELDLRIDASDDPMTDLQRLFIEATSGAYADFFAHVRRRSRGAAAD